MTTQVPFYESLDLTLCGNMGRVHRLCRDVVTIAVEPLGLTQSRWTALIHINMHKEGVTQFELAQSLGIQMPSLTRTIKQLEAQLLITRCVDEHDKRSKNIYFTEQGRKTLHILNKKITDIKNQLYSGFTGEQLDMMAHGLIKMEKNAQNCIEDHIKNKAS
ncbi:MarR family winged helix-turn-helix transcriptional regulator [Cognaticolwellia beringensis]|uniref:MarR family transcriptional regulator n=1 Tax=Cognaticolwellia beringensis TaxID=1967665 RepID=A0A222GAN7_9GAMM|nr:MarR family transcriptional regulator [Cognaticolwellia beringensis]ASP48949.1 MarR family transcriptional regulator [Cognaticolwellia beringensis]